MTDGTSFRVERFSSADLDEVWLRRACRTVWDQLSAKPQGVSVVDAPGGGQLVIKAGRERLLRASRSLRAARLAGHLRDAGVATPRVHAVCRQGPGDGYSALVMEYVPAIDFGEALNSVSAGNWVSAMAGSIAAMHAAGVRHRDLKGPNVLLVRGAKGAEAWIIDLDGARRVRLGVRNGTRARDLARLELSLDIAGAPGPGLLDAYAELAGWGAREQAKARGVIDAYKVAKRAQNARRSRELM